MSQLYISGQVFHQPGTWGAHVPVQGARVEILSGDHAVHGSDLILLATTGPNGEFSGLTTEWRTLVSRTVTDPAKPWKSVQIDEPDPEEQMLLRARIRQTTPEGVKVAILPVEYTDDVTPIAPLVVDWGPAERSVIATVNGAACTTGVEIVQCCLAELAARRDEITIEAFGESGKPYLELASPSARQRHLAAALHLKPEDVTRLRSLLAGDGDGGDAGAPEDFWTTLMVASIVFSPVTGEADSCLGLALMRVLTAGYQVRSSRNSSAPARAGQVTIALGRTPCA